MDGGRNDHEIDVSKHFARVDREFCINSRSDMTGVVFRGGKNRRHCSAHLERGCGKNVSRDEGHQKGACEQAATANRVFALATAEMSPFIGAEKTVTPSNNFSCFFSAPCGSKI